MRIVNKMKEDKNIKKRIEAMINLPDKVEAALNGTILTLKGPKGENKKNISNPILILNVEGKKITITTIKTTKREKKLVYTYRAHIKNMISGVNEGHKYILKICSSHFPMNVSVTNNQLTIKNFIGEKYPRVLQLKQGVNVKIEGNLINIESNDKELAGTAASDIEKMTKRANYDTRIFQDGIYIINKDGKDIK